MNPAIKIMHLLFLLILINSTLFAQKKQTLIAEEELIGKWGYVSSFIFTKETLTFFFKEKFTLCIIFCNVTQQWIPEVSMIEANIDKIITRPLSHAKYAVCTNQRCFYCSFNIIFNRIHDTVSFILVEYAPAKPLQRLTTQCYIFHLLYKGTQGSCSVI